MHPFEHFDFALTHRFLAYLREIGDGAIPPTAHTFGTLAAIRERNARIDRAIEDLARCKTLLGRWRQGASDELARLQRAPRSKQAAGPRRELSEFLRQVDAQEARTQQLLRALDEELARLQDLARTLIDRGY